GNFDARAQEHSKDEIGMLALALNDMASDLKGYYEDLEAKVRERTQALEKAEVKLVENVHKQDALLSSIGDGVIATDQNGAIVLINKVAEELYETEASKVLGASFTNLWHLENNHEPVAADKEPIAMALHNGVSTRSSSYSLVKQDK